MLDGRRDQVAATFRTGDIAVIRDGLASTRPNEVGDLFRYRGVLPEPRYVGPQVVHHDPGPAFGEEFDVCPPQPAAFPSNEIRSVNSLSFSGKERLNASARNRDTNCRGAMSLWQSQTHVPPQSTMRPLPGSSLMSAYGTADMPSSCADVRFSSGSRHCLVMQRRVSYAR